MEWQMTKRTRFQRDVTQPDEPDDDPRNRPPSRSEKKRQADRLTKLGVRLTELSPKALAKLEIDDDELLEAIETCRALKRGNARMRHARLVGKLLRGMDVDKIISDLIALTGDNYEKQELAQVRRDREDSH